MVMEVKVLVGTDENRCHHLGRCQVIICYLDYGFKEKIKLVQRKCWY